MEKVKEHLMAEEIKKLVEVLKNVEENVAVHSSSLRNDDNQIGPDTREKRQADVAKMIVEAIQQECQNLRSKIFAQVNDVVANHIPSQVATTCRPFTVRLRDQEDPYDDAHLEGENSAKRQKTSDYFPDDDIEERTFRWVEKFVKRFNPYAGYEVKHWKNPHAKIFYIKKQQVPRKPKEEIYSKSKIVQIIKTYWELGHEHKFITEIVARRENGSIGSITESEYKNLNKNDI
nr:hypothetical protein [Tanacetum cinerariifolium]